MKRRILTACFIIGAISLVSAQSEKSSPLQVEQYKLSNGLTVYLNEDHNQPNVFGAVVVKGGSRRDPADATGIAHYFEHIMFKGTDEIGTVDYTAEKVYLDSIEVMYDKLGSTKDEKEREAIQLVINRLSLKAAEYSIPNEFDRILSGMGSVGVNAFTSEEEIAYHNFFPANQIEKWLEVYSHRFINPVFRLFQSELETVYEEKNMSNDEFFSHIFEQFGQNFYKVHPYGQQTVLGSIDHLKNPSLSKMRDYFTTYYVANNMALILVGDFDSEKVKPMIESKFGVWRTGEIPAFPDYKEQPIKGRESVTRRLSPIRIGLLGYHTVPSGHDDDLALEVCNQLISNGSSTGLLDKLYMDNKLMWAGYMPYQHADVGANIFFFIPKLVGQRMRTVENMIRTELDKLKTGDYDEELLDAVKLTLRKEHYKSLENSNWRGYTILDAFNLNRSWDEIIAYPDEVDKITKEDIKRVAAKYYGDDYLAFYSKMGLPKKEKLKKPSYKPVKSQNSEEKSEYAKKIEAMPTLPSEPRFIEFNKDVMVADVKPNVHYYYTPNPINNIFNLKLQFGIGSRRLPVLGEASSFLSVIGTEKHDFDAFKKELQKLGSDIYCYASKDYFIVNINGLDENFEKTMNLANELLTQMKPDEKQLKKLIREAKMGRKMEDKEPYVIGDALSEKMIYGPESYYLNRLSAKEIKALSADTLIATIKEALRYEADIHYSGKLSQDEVQKIILETIPIAEFPVKSQSPEDRPRQKITENTVYFVSDKNMIQSQLSFYIDGKVVTEAEKPIVHTFNKYFGHEMHSLVFQEIREFRSLAYSAYATYRIPAAKENAGYIVGSMSTQADKTMEALQIFDSLLTQMPRKPERLDLIRTSLIEGINAYRPSFRGLSGSVSEWRIQGYNDDPRKVYLNRYGTVTFDEIVDFYNANLSGKPLAISVAGDSKQISKEELKKYGKVIEVKKKDLFKK